MFIIIAVVIIFILIDLVIVSFAIILINIIVSYDFFIILTDISIVI